MGGQRWRRHWGRENVRDPGGGNRRKKVGVGEEGEKKEETTGGAGGNRQRAECIGPTVAPSGME
jgi:hypothetical protein